LINKEKNKDKQFYKNFVKITVNLKKNYILKNKISILKSNHTKDEIFFLYIVINFNFLNKKLKLN